MTLFKDKKPIPALYPLLDSKLQEAIEQNKKCFYYPLLNTEVNIASSWALKHHIYMEVSHINGNTTVYKFSDF